VSDPSETPTGAARREVEVGEGELEDGIAWAASRTSICRSRWRLYSSGEEAMPPSDVEVQPPSVTMTGTVRPPSSRE